MVRDFTAFSRENEANMGENKMIARKRKANT
jgi:hypothetical protein